MTHNRRWNLVACDAPNWWMLDLESDPDDPLLSVVKSGRVSWGPGITGPGYARFVMDPASPVLSDVEDQARWVGIA